MNCLPDDAPCLQCVVPQQTITSVQPTCVTEGILNMTTGVIAAIQASEAVKILIHSPNVRYGLLVADVWHNNFKVIPIEKDKMCSVCSG